LPFGLTAAPMAQWIAGMLIIGSLPLIGACAGALFRKTIHALGLTFSASPTSK
jgi:hypothetical protein